MSVDITYFVHGSTPDNENGISSGIKDISLSELGRKQSIDLTDQIKDQKFNVVFCSDLKRAVESAKLTFDSKVEIIQDKRLRECNYGDFNGKPSEIVEPMQEENIIKKFPNGESYEDVKERIQDFLKYLKANFDGQNVAIVSHKAPQLALEVVLNGRTWEQTFNEDWRKRKAWQPGWKYTIN